MSYATGLRPRCPWLLLHRTIRTNLFFWSAFFPKEAAREDGDCVLQVHPLLITNQILSLPSDEIQNTAQITKKTISQSSLLPKDFLKFWKLQPTVFKQPRTYLCL